ncbi:ABC transporter permease [Lentilactobacillus senioris]|uniref:ABC transporter permease n=1 Tax=Lentilactobacillus senioris TaxID=931534 RepID=UPI000AC353E6|nr:ABC transporter permease [Lentilactobacillus senioris]
MSIIVSAIGQGLIWGVIGLGLFLTFRILDFPDMTVEGTFPLGGCGVCRCRFSRGISHFSYPVSFWRRYFSGLATGLLYTKGKIPILLAGILVMTATYSINLRIMGRANLSLYGKHTLFNGQFLNSLPPYFNSVVLGLIIIAIITAIIIYFLQTNLGQAFIATGDNPTMAKSLGISTDNMQIMGVGVSNGLIALGGALVAQNNGFADVNMGIGVIVVALASIIIGEVVFGELTMNQRLIATTSGVSFIVS